MAQILSSHDESRLRELAQGIAKDIEPADTLFKRLGFTPSDYETLCSTRSFRAMLDQAVSEWQGAGNTQKRIKLKAAVNVEMSLPAFYAAMTNEREPLAARVKVLELMMKAAAVGNPEPVQGMGGSAFNLTIQLSDGKREVVTIEGRAMPVEDALITEEIAPVDEAALDAFRQQWQGSLGGVEVVYSQSNILGDVPLEEL